MLSDQIKATFRDAAQKLTGWKKRAFMANVALEYFAGSARQTEAYLGWNRRSVQLGLDERRSGIRCVDNYGARGRKRTEALQPTLEADIRALVDGQAQADPKLKSTFTYARISARAVREALMTEKGYAEEDLPERHTIGTMLNRFGYRLKKHKR
jgi:hypothetical protein